MEARAEQKEQWEAELRAQEVAKARQTFIAVTKPGLLEAGRKAVEANPANAEKLQAMEAAIAAIEARDDAWWHANAIYTGTSLDGRAMVARELKGN